MGKVKNFINGSISKALLYIILDAIYINFSILISIGLWFDGSIPGGSKVAIPDTVWIWYLFMVILAPVICWIVYAAFRFYNNLWEYAAIEDVFKVIIANTIIFICVYFIDSLIISGKQLLILPKRMIFVACVSNIILCVLTRFGGRIVKRVFNYAGHMMSRKAGYKRVMIIGAVNTGNDFIKKIFKN